MTMIKDLFTEKSTRTTGHTQSTGRAQRNVTGRQKELYDLLNNALVGSLTSPAQRDIPMPTRQAIGGLQSILPTLFNRAYGPSAGVGTSGLGASAGGGGMALPSFGAAPTREELGLGQSHLVAPEFLPPTADVVAGLPHPRVDATNRRENVLQSKIDRRTGKGKPTGGLERRLDRMQNRPAYL